MLVLMSLCLSCGAFAEQTREELLSGLDPEQGLEQQVLDRIGPYDETESLSFPDRLRDLLQRSAAALDVLQLRDGLKTMGVILVAAIGSRLLDSGQGGKHLQLAGILAVSSACLADLHAMIGLGTDTVSKISGYALGLLPGLTMLMAAAGSVTGAGAIQAGSVFFLHLLTSLLSTVMTPMIYVLAGLSVAESALGLGTLDKLRQTLQRLAASGLKWFFFLFTAVLSLTGLFSGATDAAKLRTARLVISNMIPMVGNVVSGASDSVLNAAQILKTSVGLYGMIAVFGIVLTPFFRIWSHYMILKLTCALCGTLGCSEITGLLDKLSQTMALVLAMTGICCLMVLISFTICVKAVSP